MLAILLRLGQILCRESADDGSLAPRKRIRSICWASADDIETSAACNLRDSAAEGNADRRAGGRYRR